MWLKSHSIRTCAALKNFTVNVKYFIKHHLKFHSNKRTLVSFERTKFLCGFMSQKHPHMHLKNDDENATPPFDL
jgi:hypothetical protein